MILWWLFEKVSTGQWDESGWGGVIIHHDLMIQKANVVEDCRENRFDT